MKIWNGYASEHSMNLVMIGKFKKIADAEEVERIINDLMVSICDEVEPSNSNQQKFEPEVTQILRDHEIYTLTRQEVDQFLYDFKMNVKNDKIIIHTDESEVSAFYKLMVHKGACVEIYSAHEYPEKEKESPNA